SIPTQDGQVPPGKLPPPPSGLEPAPRLIASDGETVEPGRIPADASQGARKLWQKIVDATGGPTSESLTGFDLRFDVDVRTESSMNSLGIARYRFWSSTGYIRSEWSKSGRIQLRGPLGDWLIDKEHKTELIGRENVQSRRELSQWAAIARNFLAIATPATMRVVELSEVTELEIAFPTGALAEQAGKLAWLAVRSPDFQLAETGEQQQGIVYRAYLGQNPETGAVELAVLQEDQARRPVAESTLLVEIRAWSSIGERRIPQHLLVYRTHREGIRWTFDDRPGADLFLKKNGALNPRFQGEDFLP
ncbi:MAG: hypothetical protein ACI8QZ_004425, partial [Chlamydiales bacterium]